MSFISGTTPEQAQGETAALYARLRGNGEKVPNYALLFSHRPGLMDHIRTLMEAVREPLLPRVWQLASFAAARQSHSTYCSLAYAHKLRKEISDEALLALATDRADTALDEADCAVIDFAAQVARDASRVRADHIDRLRAAGFDDTQIFDIAAAAAYRCFFSRIADALGAAPDAYLARLPPDLLAALTVGRAPEQAGAARAN